MNDRSGADLVAACLEGDESAFAEIVDRYQRQIFNAALRITGNHADAQDVTQTSFLRAYEAMERFDPRYRFFSWIYKICVNESLNLVARRRNSVEVDRGLADRGAGPEREAEGRQVGRVILRALGALKPAHRAVIVLRHFRDLSYEEMSEILEIPGKTVKSRLFDARRELRRLLGAAKLR